MTEIIESEKAPGTPPSVSGGERGMLAEGRKLVKSRLIAKIAEIIKAREWTQVQAAQVVGLPETRLCKVLNGQLRGISEAKLLEGLARLGCNVKIVIGPEMETPSGCVDVILK